MMNVSVQKPWRPEKEKDCQLSVLYLMKISSITKTKKTIRILRRKK